MDLTPPINIRFSTAQKAGLEAVRTKTGSSLPELVRRAVDLYLRNHPLQYPNHPPTLPPIDKHPSQRELLTQPEQGGRAFASSKAKSLRGRPRIVKR